MKGSRWSVGHGDHSRSRIICSGPRVIPITIFHCINACFWGLNRFPKRLFWRNILNTFRKNCKIDQTPNLATTLQVGCCNCSELETSVALSWQVAVAVKTLKTGSSVDEKLDFLSEADMMKRFDHKNIVKLLGVCTRNEPVYTVMEFMLYGDLKTYLLAR